MDYKVSYTVTPNPATGSLRVLLELQQSRGQFKELRMLPDARVSGIEGSGSLQVDADGVRWRPAARGGTLQWHVTVGHRRNGDGYDAWLGSDWGLFRAEDIIPRAATRTLRGATSRTTLSFKLPKGWSVVTQYYDDDGQFRITNPERRFDQPNGWIVLGKIGFRRETIAGTRVAVAGPVGNSVRRMDMLALLNWTLPELARLLPELPQRLTIVSAGDPMWRGALSAPQSLFVHAERPLISENATSTILHEVMHLSLGISARRNQDWIVEGLAEHYSLELLRRSETISAHRYKTATADLVEWAATAKSLCRAASTGATSALAVTIFAALDEEIRNSTEGTASLDDLVAELWQADDPVGIAELTAVAERLIGDKPDTLHIDKLPGCRIIVAGNEGT